MIYTVIAGYLISFILFFRFPIIKKRGDINFYYQVSIIIPSRNEEKNLPLLLNDLANQNYKVHEIIVVDDCSIDDTAKVATSYNVNLISIKKKPEGWIGKSFACQKGSDAATGDLLLFLDADVRLSKDAISSLISAYNQCKCCISILPYHNMVKNYEQLSLFFNIIQVGANKLSLIYKRKFIGLFGPLILLQKDIYNQIGGHESVRNSIVDDLSLGERLITYGYNFELFLGGKLVSYRMYGNSFKDLIHGWTKNFATGAFKTPLVLLIMVYLWFSSIFITIINLTKSIIDSNLNMVYLYLVIFFLWMFELYRVSKKIGNFKIITIILYPIYLGFFLLLFIISTIKKIFKMNVVWKGRKIRLGK